MNQDNGGVIGKINTPTTLVASGVWSIQDQFEAQSSSTWPLAFPQTTFTNSCRFDSASTDRLTRTITGTNTTKFTASMWVKLADDGPSIFYANEANSSDYIFIQHNSSGNLNVQLEGTQNRRITNRVFRDPSAWYNFVIVFDSTQATASDRIKVYVNGQQETSFSTNTTNMSQNSNLSPLDQTLIFGVGNYPGESQYMNGCMAEFIAVYGQALTPSSFGATNPVTNIWEPIAYTGTYGSNGFKLNFSDSSNLGDDTSGNGNDFTVTNLTSVDQSTDTPSNNFCTMNPLASESGITFSEGNLKITSSTDGAGCGSTMAFKNGKWYFEVKYSDNANYGIGWGRTTEYTSNVGYTSTSYNVDEGGNKTHNSSFSNIFSLSGSNIIGFALDCDNQKIHFSQNGNWYNNNNSSTTLDPNNPDYSSVNVDEEMFAIYSHFSSSSASVEFNFGSPSFSISSGNADANGHGNFEYAVPSGYFALCTKNLAEHG